MTTDDDDDVTDATRLDVFCARHHDAWRTYLRTGWQPRYLRQHFDAEGEAFPAHFDFDDLERHMLKHGATLRKEVSESDGVRLVAFGRSAETLALWLASVFGTGMRQRGSDSGEQP